MKRSLRFLSLVVCSWAGVRAATLGILPGAEVFRIDRSLATPAPQPIAPTEFPPIEPPPGIGEGLWTVQPAPPAISPLAVAPAVQAAGFAPSYDTFYPSSPPRYEAAMPDRLPGQPQRLSQARIDDAPIFYSPLPTLDDWTLVPAAVSAPQRRSTIVKPARSMPADPIPQRIDRLQLTSWAMLRDRRVGSAPNGIATGGTLGASQAGARLTYNIDSRIAATLRTSSTVGQRGGEVAAGVRVRPISGIPIWLNAERRMALGKMGGGRNAFAFFIEGGVYDRPLPWQFTLDAYFQAGVAGFHRRDKFVDGAITATRPVYRNLSAGLGMWGGAQPGIYRFDAGPRVTYRVRDNIKMHMDYRQKLAGNALPGSGPVLTLAADF